jgi:hypothetical protein
MVEPHSIEGSTGVWRKRLGRNLSRKQTKFVGFSKRVLILIMNKKMMRKNEIKIESKIDEDEMLIKVSILKISILKWKVIFLENTKGILSLIMIKSCFPWIELKLSLRLVWTVACMCRWKLHLVHAALLPGVRLLAVSEKFTRRLPSRY